MSYLLQRKDLAMDRIGDGALSIAVTPPGAWRPDGGPAPPERYKLPYSRNIINFGQ